MVLTTLPKPTLLVSPILTPILTPKRTPLQNAATEGTFSEFVRDLLVHFAIATRKMQDEVAYAQSNAERFASALKKPRPSQVAPAEAAAFAQQGYLSARGGGERTHDDETAGVVCAASPPEPTQEACPSTDVPARAPITLPPIESPCQSHITAPGHGSTVRTQAPRVEIEPASAWSAAITTRGNNEVCMTSVVEEFGVATSPGSPSLGPGELPPFVFDLVLSQLTELAALQSKLMKAQTNKLAVSAAFATLDIITDTVVLVSLSWMTLMIPR